MAITFREPRKSPWETLETLTPQWIKMISDWKQIESATALRKQQAQATAQHRKDTIEQKVLDRAQEEEHFQIKESNDFIAAGLNSIKEMSPKEKRIFLTGMRNSRVSANAGDSTNDLLNSLDAAVDASIESDNRGERFFDAFRQGRANLENAFSEWGLDPNNKTHMKWWKQAEGFHNRKVAESEAELNTIKSLSTALHLFADKTKTYPPALQEKIPLLRDHLVNWTQNYSDKLAGKDVVTGPLVLDGVEINTAKWSNMSGDEIFHDMEWQIKDGRHSAMYSAQQSQMLQDLPPEVAKLLENIPIEEMPIQDFSPWEEIPGPLQRPDRPAIPGAPAESATLLGDVAVPPMPEAPPSMPLPRPDRPAMPPSPGESVDILGDLLAPAMPGVSPAYPQVAPPQPRQLSVEVEKAGIGSSTVNINGISKKVTPPELSVLQKKGFVYDKLPEKRKDAIIKKLAKKFNITESQIRNIAPAAEAPPPPEVHGYNMIKEGAGKSIVEINNIQAPVSRTELNFLKGEEMTMFSPFDKDLTREMSQKRLNQITKKLAKKFKTTEDVIKRIPFEKYRKKQATAMDSAALANRREGEQIYNAGGDFVYLPAFPGAKVNRLTGHMIDEATGKGVRTLNKADVDSLLEMNPNLYKDLPFVAKLLKAPWAGEDKDCLQVGQ